MTTAQTTAIAFEREAPYPVWLELPKEREVNRLWGLLWFGMAVRAILAIPHAIVLAVLGLCMYVVFAIGWIPILLLGRVPSLQARLISELIHRSVRVAAYIYLMPGGYPPLEPGAPGPVDVHFALEGRGINRLWGIPILGAMARGIAAIPHFFVLGVLGIALWFGALLIWIPVLLSGQYPTWGFRLFGAYLQYLARVEAYLLLLPVPYPPFSLS